MQAKKITVLLVYCSNDSTVHNKHTIQTDCTGQQQSVGVRHQNSEELWWTVQVHRVLLTHLTNFPGAHNTQHKTWNHCSYDLN